MDTQTPRSPGWWFQRLISRLALRQAYYNRFESYVNGNAPLPEGAEGCRDAYRRLQAKSRLNYGELIVEATRERMKVVGFRSGVDQATDDEMWRIWQANSLDADQALIDRPTLSMGDGYAIVGPVDQEINAPAITLEDPRQVITESDPRRRRKVVAALKVYRDDTLGVDVAYLYLPGAVFLAHRSRAFASDDARPSLEASGFEFVQAVDLRHQVVPVVRFSYLPDPNTLNPGRSELANVTDTLDRINHMVLQRVLIATMQAFRQRAVKGVPVTDSSGQDIDYSKIFAPDPGALWLLPEMADIWESQQVDLTPVLTSVRHDVQDLAAQSRTPLFYLTPDAANGSAEGASLAREGLIHKVLDRIDQAGESWEQVMSLAFLFSGKGPISGHETMWQPPERYSLAERVDAASKAGPAGVPWATVMSDVMQFSPQAVKRMASERATDALLAPQAVEES